MKPLIQRRTIPFLSFDPQTPRAGSLAGIHSLWPFHYETAAGRVRHSYPRPMKLITIRLPKDLADNLQAIADLHTEGDIESVVLRTLYPEVCKETDPVDAVKNKPHHRATKRIAELWPITKKVAGLAAMTAILTYVFLFSASHGLRMFFPYAWSHPYPTNTPPMEEALP